MNFTDCDCILCNVGVQLMRELEKAVRPNVVHFSVIDPTTTLGTTIRQCLSSSIYRRSSPI